MGVGLAKFGVFAKVAKFSLRLRNFRNLRENFRNLSENSRLVISTAFHPAFNCIQFSSLCIDFLIDSWGG